MLDKAELDINFIKSLYEKDKQIANKYHFSKCQYKLCKGVYHSAPYPRKPRGIRPEAEEFYSSRFSFCCSRCRLRFTPESIRFLGRKIYVAFFIMLMLYPPAETIQQNLIKLPPKSLAPITLRRWFLWWHIIVPKSSIWKKLVGLLLANIENVFLPIFLMDQFTREHCDLKKSLFAMLEFISPISIPANYPSFDYSILWNQEFTQRMLVQKIGNLPYIKRSD
jgi:hypothetical protein